MIDNFELIKPLFLSGEPNMFFHCQIIQRPKDHKPNRVYEGNIKTYFIRSREHLDRVKDEIILLCEHYGARAYINVAGKDIYALQKDMLMAYARNVTENIIQNPDKILNSIAGKLKPTIKTWIVDIDNVLIKNSIIEWLDKENDNTNLRNGRYLYIRAEIPTVHGCHLLTTPFNLLEFHKKFPNVDVHKNNPTLLYYPKSLDSPKYCCSVCGGINIQSQAWVNVNTHRYIDNIVEEECWCEDCQEHTKTRLING